MESRKIKWGALTKGSGYNLPSDPPWDMTALRLLEVDVAKNVSVLHFGLPWFASNSYPHGYYPFQAKLLTALRTLGKIPFVDWSSWDQSKGGAPEQPDFALRTILSGVHDAYIRSWASAAKAWAHPFFLRFDWEMNGTWYPWSEARNGNQPGEYAQVWRHVHDIFTQVGATNVTWVWCPNTIYPHSLDLAALYPGSPYVDWVGMDAYNWYSAKNNPWLSFHDIVQPTYDALIALALDKPICLGEFGCNEAGDDGTKKALWLADALSLQLPSNFPNIGMALYFDWNLEGAQWRIRSSTKSQIAFRQCISAPIYAGSDFAEVTSLR